MNTVRAEESVIETVILDTETGVPFCSTPVNDSLPLPYMVNLPDFVGDSYGISVNPIAFPLKNPVKCPYMVRGLSFTGS